MSFTTGYPSEHWIKDVARYRNGRRSLKALRDHFAGEGNQTRRIAEAERLRDSLFYKSERALSFENFLSKCQKMFNIYDQEGEPMEEDARIRFLFQKTQHTVLQVDIAALKAEITTNVPGTVSYVTCANHLSTAVSQLPEYIAKTRNVSSIKSTGNDRLYNADGTFNMSYISDYISEWKELGQDVRGKIIKERKRLNIKLPQRGTNGGGGKGGKGGNQLNKLKKQNLKFKRKIKALNKKVTIQDDERSESDEREEDVDAGDQFGGKAGKKKRKSSRE